MGNAIMTSRQAAELDHAFERNGFTAEDVKNLSKGDTLAQVRKFLLGFAEIKAIEDLINLDANPFCSDGWEVIEHNKGGQLEWELVRVELYLSKYQRNRRTIEGNRLQKELADKPVLNANVLDYLLAKSHLIPEEWKGKCIFFWGTVYRHFDGYLSVRCLNWNGRWWSWYWRWLDDYWNDSSPAALLAS